MAKKCVQCGKKIGFLSKAVDGAYCSPECAETAKRQMAEDQHKADELRAQAERQAAEKAEADQAERKLLSTCPKCGKSWRLGRGAGADGANAGDCKTCGFSTDFASIEQCPTCRSISLVVAPDGSARCPRCKHRQG